MKPIDYSQTIIYKLVPKDLNLDLQYVGHTTNFRCRKSQHKSNCNNISEKNTHYNRKVYQMIRENGGWNKWEMIEIEKYPCNDKNEACKRERELMEEFNANLNMNKSFRTKDDVKKALKKYYEKNKDAVKASRKKWQEKNKDIMYAIHKKYREKNRDAINARRKELKEQKKLSLDML